MYAYVYINIASNKFLEGPISNDAWNPLSSCRPTQEIGSTKKTPHTQASDPIGAAYTVDGRHPATS